tara:strand:+ start:9090 stop:9287 length:198 start_codon:yes stop_codon:yes gene_type:complete
MDKKVYIDKVVYYNENKQHHNDKGPAVEWYDGHKEWWINGKQLTEKEFLLKLRKSKIEKVMDKKS